MTQHNLTQLGENVQHLAKAYKSVIDLGEALREIGSLEQRAKEAGASAANAAARNDEAQKALHATLAGLAAARDEAQKLKESIELAQREAREAVAAQLEAATALAEGVIAEAKKAVEDAKTQADLQKRTHEAWLAKAAEDRDAAAAELNRINALIGELRAKLG